MDNNKYFNNKISYIMIMTTVTEQKEYTSGERWKVDL